MVRIAAIIIFSLGVCLDAVPALAADDSEIEAAREAELKPGFGRTLAAAFKLNHTLLRDSTYSPADEVVPEDWRAIDNMQGFELYAQQLIRARTPSELAQMKE